MHEERSWVLPAAAGVMALENIGVLGALLLVRDVPPLVPLFMFVKFPFCVALVQRRHGAFMLLMLWEATTFVIALVNPALDLLPRLVLLGVAALGLTLLGMAMPLFPPARLPRSAE